MKTVVMISRGLWDKLELGNLNSSRDIGNSKDYVRAMHLMLQQDKPDDYVVATGFTVPIRLICSFGLDYFNLGWDKVEINDKYTRPEELRVLRGDSSKMRSLGWEPKFDSADTFMEMINYWQEKL